MSNKKEEGCKPNEFGIGYYLNKQMSAYENLATQTDRERKNTEREVRHELMKDSIRRDRKNMIAENKKQ